MGCQITTPCKGTAWLVNVGATDAPYCGPFWRILFLPGTKINLKHMSKICKEEWAKITQENFNKLVNDYWNYIETVVAANVRHTYYKTLIYLLFLLFFYAAKLLVSNCMNTFVIAIIYKNICLGAIISYTSMVTLLLFPYIWISISLKFLCLKLVVCYEKYWFCINGALYEYFCLQL